MVTLVIASMIPSEYFGPYRGFKQEFDYRFKLKRDMWSQRDRLINTALEVAGDSITGSGLGSFGLAADLSEVKSSIQERKGDWKAEKRNYVSSSHGHNIFANILVERGWIGVILITVFLSILFIAFWRKRHTDSGQIGMLTVIATCFGGLGQSTLHVEHGQLTFICFALSLLYAEHYNSYIVR